MSKIDQIIEKALTGVRKELANHQAGVGTVSSPDQLKRFETQLAGMLEDLRQGRFNADRVGMGRVVADSWPLDHVLGNLICAADQAYRGAAK